ncbi:hypothetical protein THAOC_30280 [Thalassiosira oceanica]|uniref:Uncharacterized protein n=1 Tax=Thalassiosira oceanica TaxID=159749 RepID=K0REP8_THAOC|nr:hypothetical protein THAOC_30280 [Thalassiosira oceanica]|eukprot:EJK50679.1 hypothetical protein THAOC_30280 [Thalassiosira oceanica]
MLRPNGVVDLIWSNRIPKSDEFELSNANVERDHRIVGGRSPTRLPLEFDSTCITVTDIREMPIIEVGTPQTDVRTEEETREDGTRIVKTITTETYPDGRQCAKTQTRTITTKVEEEEIIYRPFRNLAPYFCCCFVPFGGEKKDDAVSAENKPGDTLAKDASGEQTSLEE